MRTRTTAAITAGLLLVALTACGSSSDDKPVAPARKSTINQADRDEARKTADLPLHPSAEVAAAYVKDLDAIDPDIVHGNGDEAVSRGIDTCGIYKRFAGDETKQADQANRRWNSPTHPDGHGLATAKKILTVTHKHLCPTSEPRYSPPLP
ncbi:hypothetical protein [Streptomyces sp. NPDC056707]|uniref:hypothetical protein n=1 Tax=Streptomyces sp. NPDC056707 TaxID=3345919 RepID=UPI0036BF8A2C